MGDCRPGRAQWPHLTFEKLASSSLHVRQNNTIQVPPSYVQAKAAKHLQRNNEATCTRRDDEKGLTLLRFVASTHAQHTWMCRKASVAARGTLMFPVHPRCLALAAHAMQPHVASHGVRHQVQNLEALALVLARHVCHLAPPSTGKPSTTTSSLRPSIALGAGTNLVATKSYQKS